MIKGRTVHGANLICYLKLTIVSVGVAFFVAFVLPLAAPHDPYAVDLGSALMSPCEQYPFGTDALGRCVLSRVLYGARVSLGVTVVLVVVMGVVGVGAGLLSGYRGGLLDSVIMRVTDVFLAFPNMVLALAIAGTLGPGLINTAIAMTATGWTKYARFTRGLVLQERGRNYIATAKMSGARRCRILLRYLLPNVFPQILTMMTVDLGSVLLGIAGMSFLGLGIQPPVPEWGSMICEGRGYLQTAPWISLFPGLAIFVSVLIANLFSNRLAGRFSRLAHTSTSGDGVGKGASPPEPTFQ